MTTSQLSTPSTPSSPSPPFDPAITHHPQQDIRCPSCNKMLAASVRYSRLDITTGQNINITVAEIRIKGRLLAVVRRGWLTCGACCVSIEYGARQGI